MDLPRGQVEDQVWLEHIERVKTYSGTMAAYCRLHNLDYDKFMYYRGRTSINGGVAAKSSGFAKVKATTAVIAPAIAKSKNYPLMPDPKWLAELIHNLVYEK